MSKQCDVCILWLGKGRKSNLKVKLPLQRDLHVHGATEAPYWPILACDTRVRVKTRYFEKLKINISTCRIQTKFSTWKRLNTRSILLLLTCGKFQRVFLDMKYRMFGQAASKYAIILVCVMLLRHLTPRSKGYFMRISTVVSVLMGGEYSSRYFHQKQLNEKYKINS
jgi:hypothetical protein